MRSFVLLDVWACQIDPSGEVRIAPLAPTATKVLSP
jgi:hypothetical protein